jgi:tRNA-splicing ligase RtcB
MNQPTIEKIDEFLYEIGTDYRDDMRVPVRIIASDELLEQIQGDLSIDQLINVSTLPGVFQVVGMPDMHQGYGFPVGGVAATLRPEGVISPGGIGFDINCGVRLLATNLPHDEIADEMETLVHQLMRSIPTGYGRSGRLTLDDSEMERVLNEGAPYLVNERELGHSEDLGVLESGGFLHGAEARHVSDKAKSRGSDQLGTLGGGNHFLEVQVVDEIFDERAAKAFGLVEGEVTVLIHTGSRGLGHQVCTDYLKEFDDVMDDLGIELPDAQLACAPLESDAGQRYFAGMCAAANFAFCNRQVLTHRVREVFDRELGDRANTIRIVYDVAHNIAKLEEHQGRPVCVHRKGATRAFGPSEPDVPEAYRAVGQPVFIPGSMGTSSFVLVGKDRSRDVSLCSTCHGAGRRMSRSAAKKEVEGHLLRKELESRGIVVRCPSNSELAEEAPRAYKDVDRVVDVVAGAGIAGRVARLRPVGVLKG